MHLTEESSNTERVSLLAHPVFGVNGHVFIITIIF